MNVIESVNNPKIFELKKLQDKKTRQLEKKFLVPKMGNVSSPAYKTFHKHLHILESQCIHMIFFPYSQRSILSDLYMIRNCSNP